MTRRFLTTACLLMLAVVLPSADAGPKPPPSEVTVLLKDASLTFEARDVTLQLGKDGTAKVTWRWDSQSVRPHNVEADDGTFDSHPGCGESGVYGLGTGTASCGFTGLTSYTRVFRKPGVYRYHCAIHGGARSGMAGSVIVKAIPKVVRRT